ncbi:putative polygalacturonase [Nymphaea thermarum]|nr:putative polygalacturonase [Nymphaea thermarum]
MDPSTFLPSLRAFSLVLLISILDFSHCVALSETQIFHSSFDVVEFGAVGDGRTFDTTAFLKAWEAACRTPGPVKLVIPYRRTFLLGPVYFNGNCISHSIHVQILGNIVAPASPSSWAGQSTAHWLSFYQVRNLVIDGTGTIDGRGSAWWDCKRRSDQALEIINCRRVKLSGITSLNSQGVHVKIVFSQYVTVSNIKIIAPEESPNTDGINMGASQYVDIHDCNIQTGDDCIAMLGGSKFINISRISCGPGHGVSIGSLGRYSDMDIVDHVYVTDVNFYGTTNGARIKTWQGGNGLVTDVVFKNLFFWRAQNPIIIDQFYCPNQKSCPIYREAVKIQGVSFIRAVGTTTSDVAINLKCSDTVPCTDIVLKYVNLQAADPHEKTKAYCSNTRGRSSSIVLPRVPCLYSL